MKRHQTQPDIRPSAAILIIDDDPVASAAAEDTLTQAGYRVLAESKGDAALRLMRTAHMRLVVSELYIPSSENGYVVTALKADRARIPRVRVLIHTSHRSPEDIEFALASGADTFVRKPVKPEVLLREVKRLAGPPTA